MEVEDCVFALVQRLAVRGGSRGLLRIARRSKTVNGSWANNIAFGASPAMDDGPNSFPTATNKVNTHPMFVSLGANYALEPGSPAIGAGAVVPYWQQQTAGSIDVGACPHEATTCP